MKKLSLVSLLLMFVSGVSNSAPKLMEGEYTFYDVSGINVLTSTYSGEIDVENKVGELQSLDPFFGADWTSHIVEVIVYDNEIGGVQHYSWDVTVQTWLDLNRFTVIQCYIESNQCDDVGGNAIFLGETVISHPVVMNQSGQFAIGTFVNWSIEEIPVLMTLQSESGELNPESTSFISFDGDADGLPGYAMVAQPFPGQTFSFSGFIGSKDGIFVSDLLVAGGSVQECTSENGSVISASANITVNNDMVESIEWFINDSIVGTGSNVASQIPLGEHQLSIVATATSGKTASLSSTITVRDTTSPELVVEFIDTKSNDSVNVIDRRGLTRLIASYNAVDLCDPSPAVDATGGFSISNQSFLPLKVLNDEIIMDVPELTVSAVATDASGNTVASSAKLVVQ